MASFFGRILTIVLPFIMDWVYSRVSKEIQEALAKKKAGDDIAKKNQEAREQTEKADTPKEREDAAKNIIDGF